MGKVRPGACPFRFIGNTTKNSARCIEWNCLAFTMEDGQPYCVLLGCLEEGKPKRPIGYIRGDQNV